jgi:hypothetical protein
MRQAEKYGKDFNFTLRRVLVAASRGSSALSFVFRSKRKDRIIKCFNIFALYFLKINYSFFGRALKRQSLWRREVRIAKWGVA